MDAPWFPEAPANAELAPLQNLALERFRRLLQRCGPEHTDPGLTEAKIDEGGFLHLAVRHRDENFEVALYVSDAQVVASWGDIEREELTITDYHSGEEALRAALDFVKHVLLG